MQRRSVFFTILGGVSLEITKEYVEQLVDHYGDMALRIAYHYFNNRPDAEDVVQELFLRVMEKRPVFQDRNHEKAWMIRATLNLCKNKSGLFWNRHRCSLEAAENMGREEPFQSGAVWEAVAALPSKNRIVIYLYYYEGYKTPEIAKLLGKGEGTVRSLLHRARLQLKEELKEEYDFE